jgi:hypothetical protein
LFVLEDNVLMAATRQHRHDIVIFQIVVDSPPEDTTAWVDPSDHWLCAISSAGKR